LYELDKSKNSTYSLHYHFITVVKYRQKVFTSDDMVKHLKDIVVQISEGQLVDVIEMGVGIDHMHILFKAKPTLDLPKYINTIKGQTSRAMRTQYAEHLKDKLWGDAFWSPSYFLATTGNVTIDILKKYVENQRQLQE